MKGFFFMRSGSAKSIVNDDEGHESIMSFLLPTDIVGTASMDQTVYHDSVVTLERSSFCEVTTRDLEALFRADAFAQKRFFGMVADRIGIERHARMRLERASADERLADFIAELSDRFSRLGRDPLTFQLTMSRYDIANYIGLAAETVSRVLRRLSDKGIIAVQHKNIRILDVSRLRRAATHRDADAR